MKTLLKNAKIVNVFTDTLDEANILIENDRVIGVGDYTDADADFTEDLAGKYVCPGFIDGHIHIESTMLTPAAFARVSLPHGTTAVIADPHEITNVCGGKALDYMLESSKGLPLDVYIALPSCVPATPFDESGAVMNAEDLAPYLDNPRVVSLGEMMNYPGVIYGDEEVMKKLSVTKKVGKPINGHAPLLAGHELDRYVSAGIFDDHECTNADEAIGKMKKGQWIMIREGSAAKDLDSLLPLFDEPYSRRCMLVTDDKAPAELLNVGHLDNSIRKAVSGGKSVFAAIRMASLQAASYYGLRNTGAVAPGYFADLLVLDDLEGMVIRDVYKNGRKVVSCGTVADFTVPTVNPELESAVRNSFRLKELSAEDFFVVPSDKPCHVIRMIPGKLLTGCENIVLDFSHDNGIDLGRDILKLAVIERHKNTGHIGLGYMIGTGMKKGAIASSVSHDSHNLIVLGTNDVDMAFAANRIRSLGGGLAVVENGKVLAEMPLPVAGLMGDVDAAEAARQDEQVHSAVHLLGVDGNVELFMHTAFVSLTVIPDLKLSTQGLVDVVNFRRIPLFEE